MENRNPFHERRTPVLAEAPLLIACSDPAMFARAHLYALDSCRTSLLVPPHEICRLDELLAAYPMMQVATDYEDTSVFAEVGYVAASSLPSIETIPIGIAPEQVVAVLLTSGTTGRAKLVEKTFAMFACEAASLSELFCREDDAVRVVTSVPLEHMFGYQYGFFWPRLADMESSLVRALTPAAIRSQVEGSDRSVWLVTTPLHLRYLVDSGFRSTRIRRIFSATSPIPEPLAARVLRSFGVPVTDIYGSTETGTIGWRELVGRDEVWRCIPGRHLEVGDDDAVELHGREFPTPAPVSDILELHDDKTFRIAGRRDDLVKVAGKRTTLGALNGALLAGPGVRDGTFWMPEHPHAGSEVRRTVAFVVLAPGASANDVLRDLRTRLDPVFLPRPVYVVDSLCRTSIGKLPTENIRKLYDCCRNRHAADQAILEDQNRVRDS